jgi:hypothetical protein
MTTTAVRPSTTEKVPMTWLRKTALAGGTFYLITFVSSIPALFLLSPVLHHADYIISSGSDTQVLCGICLDLTNALAAIGSAVALFPVIKRQNESFALGFVTSRVIEAAVILIGLVSLLTVVTLRQPGATGADAASLVGIGKALVEMRNWTFLLGPGMMPAFNALLLGYLMYRSRLVPRIIPVMGLIGAPLLFAAAIATVLGLTTQLSPLSGIATAPIFAWELSLGLWLTFKGFKPSPITAGMVTS